MLVSNGDCECETSGAGAQSSEKSGIGGQFVLCFCSGCCWLEEDEEEEEEGENEAKEEEEEDEDKKEEWALVSLVLMRVSGSWITFIDCNLRTGKSTHIARRKRRTRKT